MKKTIGRLMIGLVALLSAGLLFAACAPKSENVTVTFVANRQTVQEVTVEKGKALASTDIPTDPSVTDYEFDGWFIGDTAFTGAETFDADTTITAKLTRLYTVTFKANDTTVKTVKVRDGETVKPADIPTDEDIDEDYALVSWKVGAAAFDETSPVTADLEVTAVLERVVFQIGFVIDGQTHTVKTDNEGYLLKTQIPSVTAPEGKVFLGWADESGAQATFDTETWFDADKTFTAKFAAADAIMQTWFLSDGTLEFYFKNEAGKLEIYKNGAVLKDGSYNKVFATVDGLTASWSYRDNGSHNYTLAYQFDDTAVLTHRYYDPMEEAWINDEPVTLTAFEAVDTSAYAGTYSGISNNSIIVGEDGTISRFGTAESLFATKFRVNGQNVTIQYSMSSSIAYVYQYTGTIDGKKLILRGGEVGKTPQDVIFYRAAQNERAEYTAKIDDVYNYIYVFDQGTEDETILYAHLGVESCFVTADGEIAAGNIVTLTKQTSEAAEMYVKFGDDTFAFRGAEYGDFTAAGADKLSLDGFTTATLGSATYEYTLNGDVVVLYDNGSIVKGVELDRTAKTYAELTADAYAGTYSAVDGSTTYVMVLDGFGGAVLSYSKYTYGATYTVNADGVEMTPEEGSYYFGGVFAAYQHGNILVQTTNKRLVYVAKDYTVVEPDAGVFDGTWKNGETIVIVNSASSLISFNGTLTAFTLDYDNAMHFTVGETAYTAKITDGALTVNAGAEPTTFAKESDSTELPKVVTDENLVGKFSFTYDEYGEGYTSTGSFTIDASGMMWILDASGIAEYDAATNTVTLVYVGSYSTTRYTVQYQDNVYTLKSEYTSNGTSWYENWKADSVEKQIVFPSAFVGTYKGNINGQMGNGETAVVVNADGKATYTRGGVEIVFTDYVLSSSDTVVWTLGDNQLTLKQNASDYTLTIEDTLESYTSTGAVTKQA